MAVELIVFLFCTTFLLGAGASVLLSEGDTDIQWIGGLSLVLSALCALGCVVVGLSRAWGL